MGDGYCDVENDPKECKNDGGDCLKSNELVISSLLVNGELLTIEKYERDTQTYSIIQRWMTEKNTI